MPTFLVAIGIVILVIRLSMILHTKRQGVSKLILGRASFRGATNGRLETVERGLRGKAWNYPNPIRSVSLR